MNIINRTEELINTLRNKRLQIHEKGNGIFCDGGQLMGFPFYVWVIPFYGYAHLFVNLPDRLGGSVLSANLNYINTIPLEMMFDEVIDKLIYSINNIINSTSMDIKNEGNRKCKLTLKAGDREFGLVPFQSPRGLRHENKRPDVLVMNCYQEFSQVDLFRFIEYLQDVACSMQC